MPLPVGKAGYVTEGAKACDGTCELLAVRNGFVMRLLILLAMRLSNVELDMPTVSNPLSTSAAVFKHLLLEKKRQIARTQAKHLCHQQFIVAEAHASDIVGEAHYWWNHLAHILQHISYYVYA